MKRDPRTGKFLVRWRADGRHRSRSFTLKADAERFKRDVERAKEIGRPLEIDRGRETMAEFVEIYWRRYAVPSLAGNTLDGYGRVWERHLRQPLGGLRLREVRPAVVPCSLKQPLSPKGPSSLALLRRVPIIAPDGISPQVVPLRGRRDRVLSRARI